MAETVLRKSTRTLIQVAEALGIHNLDPEPGKIFVTGGTGVIGHRVATRLLHAGYPSVRLGRQNLESVADMNKLGAEIADFSWGREDMYEKALEGVTSVLCTIQYANMWYKHFPKFLEACQKAGVKHIVKISFYHAEVTNDIFQNVPLVREHGDCDDQLIQMVSPLPTVFPILGSYGDVGLNISHLNMSYTILHASHFMSNPFTAQGKELRSENKPSSMFGASGNRGVNYVSPNDVAEVAVRILVAPREHCNKTYTLTGLEAITDQQVADLLSKYLNKPIMYVDQPLLEFSNEMKVSGVPKWMVADLESLEKIKASGVEEDPAFISNDIENICGHPPETFEDYLRGTDMMTKVECGPPSVLQPLKTL